MRSVVVVLPASTWAMMPILRISERGVVRAISRFHHRVERGAEFATARRPCRKNVNLIVAFAREGTPGAESCQSLIPAPAGPACAVRATKSTGAGGRPLTSELLGLQAPMNSLEAGGSAIH